VYCVIKIQFTFSTDSLITYTTGILNAPNTTIKLLAVRETSIALKGVISEKTRIGTAIAADVPKLD
jgi:hypothetical protein